MQSFFIGRDQSNQIILNDNMVSRRHAQLTLLDNGLVMIKDLGSSNGTYVNGKKITEAYLSTGDIVKCGPVFLNWSQYTQGSPSNDPYQENVDFVSVASKAQEWNNKFFSFIKPFLGTIDSGLFFRRVFSWIYTAIAILNILLPLYILFKAIDANLFKDAPGKFVMVFLVSWLVWTLLCWFGFQLWWNRREKVHQASYSGAEFVATPVLAHLIQTFGEWFGIFVGVMGFLMGLLSLLLSQGYNYPGFDQYGYRDYNDSFILNPFFGDVEWRLILLGPLVGFLIVFLFRFFAEAIKALSVIANNTKKQ